MGQYEQQDSRQVGPSPSASATYQHSVQSPHRSAFSIPANHLSGRQGDQPQQVVSRAPLEDPDDRNRQAYTSIDRNSQFSPRSTSGDPRMSSQPRGYSDPQAAVSKEARYDHGRPQGHWRQPSHEAGDARNGARDYNRAQATSGGRTATLPSKIVDPYRNVLPARDERGSSTSTSQPDLLRYLDPAPDPLRAPRPTGEPLLRPGESYHPAAYQAYPVAPAHSRSASNPVILRAQGSNASASAVDSLFAYHQKSPPALTPQRAEPQTSQYVPPPIAVQHISMQAQGQASAPAKPPRLVPSSGYPPYDYARRDSDPQGHAQYAQQVSTVFRVLPERHYVMFGSLLAQIRLSTVVCCNDGPPYSGVKPFGNISSLLCTLAIL